MGFNYNPQKDIPDLSGKVILLTGGTAGIGKTAVLALAAHSPEQIIFTGRNATAGQSLVEQVASVAPQVKVTFMKCDLSSLASIKRTIAEQFTSDRLDIFIANAGIMAHPPAVTEDGYELQFGTNHMGHALMLKLLLPVMLKTAEEGHDVRFVSLSSMGHMYTTTGGISFDKLKTADHGIMGNTWAQYGQSKLANILLAKAMAKRYPQITSVAIHPGVVNTNLMSARGTTGVAFSKIFGWVLTTAEQGAYNTLWAATAPKGSDGQGVANGGLYNPVGKPMPASKFATDEKLADRLWEWTENELKSYEPERKE